MDIHVVKLLKERQHLRIILVCRYQDRGTLNGWHGWLDGLGDMWDGVLEYMEIHSSQPSER